LKLADFKAKAQGENVVVIDIREPFQRQEIPDLPKMRNIPSDRLVQLLASHEFKGKQLLIFDAVGKQVEWLQYYLVNYGYKNYSFLDSGVLSAKEAGALKQ
ncbi:MAG TPA: rhodanese-like domain-containing protein, partial [Geobacterales bacterium]|nr:rhodanese-like domain-containing protein [Geobacterales bacterium]